VLALHLLWLGSVMTFCSCTPTLELLSQVLQFLSSAVPMCTMNNATLSEVKEMNEFKARTQFGALPPALLPTAKAPLVAPSGREYAVISGIVCENSSGRFSWSRCRTLPPLVIVGSAVNLIREEVLGGTSAHTC
jgi:hypothetical protein